MWGQEVTRGGARHRNQGFADIVAHTYNPCTQETEARELTTSSKATEATAGDPAAHPKDTGRGPKIEPLRLLNLRKRQKPLHSFRQRER